MVTLSDGESSLKKMQIDPNRTVSAGKVDIGAFRTYPEGYTPASGGGAEYQSIPLAKIEDFGVHANQYYSLDVEIFKSSLDEELLGKLWNKYWVNTLSSSPLISVYRFLWGVFNYFLTHIHRIAHTPFLSLPTYTISSIMLNEIFHRREPLCHPTTKTVLQGAQNLRCSPD